MATVLEAFNQPGVGFVLIRAGQKVPPIEKGWQDKSHSYQALDHDEGGRC